MEIKRSALALFPISVRPFNVTKTSLLRVYITFVSEQFRCIILPNFKAMSRLIFFSCNRFATAPGSLPPCPASITTTNLSFASISTVKNRAEINATIYIYIVFFMRYTNEQNLFRAKFSPYAAKIAKNKKTLLFKT